MSTGGVDVRTETGSPITAHLGAAPGDLIHIGQPPDGAPRVSIMEFMRREYREEQCPLDESLHPESRWPWACPAVWAVMAAIAAGLLAVFCRKRWR